MAGMFTGVDGVCRKVKGQFSGVDGVCRRVKGGYIGVAAVCRKFFSSWYWQFGLQDNTNVTVTSETRQFVEGVLTISTTYKGNASSNINGRNIHALLHGDFWGKSISFDYIATNYDANYGSIAFEPNDASGNVLSTKLLTSSGSYSGTLPSNTDYLFFGIWMGGRSSSRTASLVVKNLKIGGETIK